jgi:chromosome segregation ATPase
MATKAKQIWDEVNELVREGTTRADAFKAKAEEYGRPVDSIRGSYYTHKRKLEGGDPDAKPSRTRRRETTPDDALSDARAALERAIDAIDREVEAAKARAEEAKAEYEALQASAEGRKQAITERLEALK